MTGGVGYEQLKRFYAYHFIPVNPPDFRLTLISRAVGTNTLVDEFIVKFTHTTEIDWMLPGIPPTGRKVEIPTVAIIKIRATNWYISTTTGTGRLVQIWQSTDQRICPSRSGEVEIEDKSCRAMS